LRSPHPGLNRPLSRSRSVVQAAPWFGKFFCARESVSLPAQRDPAGLFCFVMAWLDKNGQTGHVAGYFSPFGDRFGRTCVWLAADPRRVHGVGRAIVSGQTSARAGRPERRLIDSCSEYRLAAIHLITGCAGRGGRASRPSPGFLCIGRKMHWEEDHECARVPVNG
jgi:hypothetical protein